MRTIAVGLPFEHEDRMSSLVVFFFLCHSNVRSQPFSEPFSAGSLFSLPAFLSLFSSLLGFLIVKKYKR
jgi:hypothetical protein